MWCEKFKVSSLKFKVELRSRGHWHISTSAHQHISTLTKFLIIQTAFLGDVILATPLVEKLHAFYPQARIDFLLRKGNEILLANNPHIHDILIWDKSQNKTANLLRMLGEIRKRKYDVLINAQRFFSTGMLAAFSGAKEIVGFDKNPMSFLYNKRIKHIIGSKEKPFHEAERNLMLIRHLTDDGFVKPKVYPSENDFKQVKTEGKYVCIAPGSIWFTKQFPKEKWIELIGLIDKSNVIYLLGGKDDAALCEQICKKPARENVISLAGKINLMQSAALMKNAEMNYVNDSAPMHLASAVNAPVTAVFCSTIPEFGFTPLSGKSKVVETRERLSCRPCGIHGFSSCPQGHFKCAEIDVHEIV